MSRFYQALREASRSRQNDAKNPGEAAWAALGGSAHDVPPVEPVSPEPAVTAAPLRDETWIPSREMEDAQSAIVPDSGFFGGTTAKVALDQKARLIPHAVDGVIVEHYRRLRTKLIQQQAEKSFRSLMITSPNPQEGKSVTTLNLGLSFAMLPNFKVLVVDGDLRRGSLGKWLGVEDHPGLSNLLDGSATLEEVVLKCDEIPIHFMVSGNSAVPPAELLQSARSNEHFRRMTEHFSLVLVDSPPVNLITDAQLLAESCDAVLLVVRAFSTSRKSLEKAAHDLQSFRVLGTVLNAGAKVQLYKRYHGYY